MLIFLAGKPPGMPYWLSPTVQALMAASIEYLPVPPGIGVIGSFGPEYSGAWWFVGPFASQPPCMSYVMTSRNVRYWPTLSVSMFLILSWPAPTAAAVA